MVTVNTHFTLALQYYGATLVARGCTTQSVI